MLPGTYYLVRMLDGRIDTQGTVKDLRAQGVLEEIAHAEAIDDVESVDSKQKEGEGIEDSVAKPAEEAKKARQLVKDEHRETGQVKVRSAFHFGLHILID